MGFPRSFLEKVDSIRKHALSPCPFALVAWKADVMAGIAAAICGHVATVRMKDSAKDGGIEKQELIPW